MDRIRDRKFVKSHYLLVPGLRDSDDLVPGFPGPFGTEKLLCESREDFFFQANLHVQKVINLLLMN